VVTFKGAHFETTVTLPCVRWYLAYPLSYRQLEEMMQERGVAVDHSTINRWVLKYTPRLEQEFRRRKRPVGTSWHLDETYITVRGQWKYLYRAVDKAGQTVDFLLTARRDCHAAQRFLEKAIRGHGAPAKITVDQSGANAAAIGRCHAEYQLTVEVRPVNYLNNIVEQDRRAIKRVTWPTLGFKAFWAAQGTLAGIELRHMITKGQLVHDGPHARPPTSSMRWQQNSSREKALLVHAQNVRQHHKLTLPECKL
jgi:putative transposase